MSTTHHERVQIVTITSDADVVAVRQAVRALAAQAALSLVDQTKLITAASELARNTLVYGGGGTAELALVATATGSACRLASSTRGRGSATSTSRSPTAGRPVPASASGCPAHGASSTASTSRRRWARARRW